MSLLGSISRKVSPKEVVNYFRRTLIGSGELGRKEINQIKGKLKNLSQEDKERLKTAELEDLTPEEDAAYLTYFSIMLRSRENQHYQYSIGMIDASEWDNYQKSFKTLFKSEYHMKLWGFMKETFNDEFVKIVDGIINENN